VVEVEEGPHLPVNPPQQYWVELEEEDVEEAIEVQHHRSTEDGWRTCELGTVVSLSHCLHEGVHVGYGVNYY